MEIVPSERLYYKRSHTPISGAATLVETQFTPRRPTNVAQSDSSTYEADTITLEWTAPSDTGCMPVLDYEIEELDTVTMTWAMVGQVGSAATTGVATDLTPGELTSLRVVAKNAVGAEYGAASETIQLTPAALPGTSSYIQVVEYGENYLLLEWDVPADTGAGD